MRPAAKVVLQIQLFLRRRSLVRNFISPVAIVDQDKIGLVGLDAADVNRPRNDVNIFQAEDLETVAVRILDIVSVRDAGALSAPVVERILTAFLHPVLIRKVRLSSHRLDCCIENRPRLAGIVGVIHVDGRRRRSGRWRSLGRDQAAQKRHDKKAMHSY
jgi:hypothetical protein